MRKNQIGNQRTAQIEVYGRQKKSSYTATIEEMKYIGNNCVGDSLAYFMLVLQLADKITSVEEISDKHIANILGTSESTIKKRRLSLVKSKMIKFTKEGNIKRVLIGYEAVVFHDMFGWDVIKVDVVRRVKSYLGIKSMEDFIENVDNILGVFESNPEMFDK